MRIWPKKHFSYRYGIGLIALVFIFGFLLNVQEAKAASLTKYVNKAFREAFRRNPNKTEHGYWYLRVSSGDKKTYKALVGAMLYHKSRGKTMGAAVASSKEDTKVLLKLINRAFREVFGRNPKKDEHAYWYERVKYKDFVTFKQLKGAMFYHKAKGKTIGEKIDRTKKKKVAVVTKAKVEGVGTHKMGDLVRIGIYGTTGEVVVGCSGKYQIREGRDKILKTLGPDSTVKISYSGDKYHIRGGYERDTDGYIRLVPLNMAIMEVKSYKDKGTSGTNYNKFRGVIEVRKEKNQDKITAINELRTEYYLRGLAESGDQGPEEYYKALGVAARTYVLYHKSKGGRRPWAYYDIGNTSDDQIYRGYNYEKITPRLSSIFDKIKGVLVTKGNQLVVTTYFSRSDGKTRSAKEKWGTDKFPHLQSVEDPYGGSKLWGHGVGMCAQGARGYADKENRSYQWILKHYYKGIDIKRAY